MPASDCTRKAKVMLDCAFCFKPFGPYLPGEAKRITYCSRPCAAKAKTRTLVDGEWTRPTADCLWCGSAFILTKDRRKLCSVSCAQKKKIFTGSQRSTKSALAKAISVAHRSKVTKEIRSIRRIAKRMKGRISTCINCGSGFVRGGKRKFSCSLVCHTENKRMQLRKSRAVRKAREKTATVEPIDPIEVLKRDKWKCYICGVDTPYKLKGKHKDNAPEVEHVLALSNGGTHTWDNVRCSCRKCNLSKGSKILP